MSAPHRALPRNRPAPPPPSRAVWLGAAAELALAAATVAVLVQSSSGDDARREMAGAGMVHVYGPELHSLWSWQFLAPGALLVVAAVVWLVTHATAARRTVAVAIGLAALSSPVRALATGSHVVLMLVVEATLTAVPLLLLPTRGPPSSARAASGRWTSVAALTVTACFAAAVVGVHLPGIHSSMMAGGSLPWWAVMLLMMVGVLFFGVIGAFAVSPAPVRRIAFTLAQEVSALTGLVTLIGGAAVMGAGGHAGVGLSPGWDHRLGGAVMLLGCAAVLAIARRERWFTADGRRTVEANVVD